MAPSLSLPTLPRLASALAVAIALAWALPDLFQRVTAPERVRVAAFYSAPTDGFVIRTTTADRSHYTDEGGKVLSEPEARRRLPFLYFADLAKHGLFPDRVAGVAVTPEEARRQLQVMQLSSRSWTAPAVPLYILFESAPWGTRLSLPGDMMRASPTGVEFLRAADGAVLAEKSARFTAAATRAGVVWPLAALGGNPSPLKEFDDGLILVDATAHIFQMRMVEGQPAIRATGTTVPGTVRWVAVDEHPRRDILAALVTDDDIWLLGYDDSLVRLPAPGFAAERSLVTLRTDPLHRSVTIADQRDPLAAPSQLVVTDPAYQAMRSFRADWPAGHAKRLRRLDHIASLLSPVAVVQDAPELGRLALRLVPAASPALAAAAGLVACALLWGWRRRFGPRPVMAAELVLTLAGGLPMLLALVALGPLAPARR